MKDRKKAKKEGRPDQFLEEGAADGHSIKGQLLQAGGKKENGKKDSGACKESWGQERKCRERKKQWIVGFHAT